MCWKVIILIGVTIILVEEEGCSIGSSCDGKVTYDASVCCNFLHQRKLKLFFILNWEVGMCAPLPHLCANTSPKTGFSKDARSKFSRFLWRKRRYSQVTIWKLLLLSLLSDFWCPTQDSALLFWYLNHFIILYLIMPWPRWSRRIPRAFCS